MPAQWQIQLEAMRKGNYANYTASFSEQGGLGGNTDSLYLSILKQSRAAGNKAYAEIANNACIATEQALHYTLRDMVASIGDNNLPLVSGAMRLMFTEVMGENAVYIWSHGEAKTRRGMREQHDKRQWARETENQVRIDIEGGLLGNTKFQIPKRIYFYYPDNYLWERERTSFAGQKEQRTTPYHSIEQAIEIFNSKLSEYIQYSVPF